MAKQPLLPDEPEVVDPKAGVPAEVIDPNEQKQLDTFYREHPEAMRKWVDTDASAFNAFPEGEGEDSGSDTADDDEFADSDIDTDDTDDFSPDPQDGDTSADQEGDE